MWKVPEETQLVFRGQTGSVDCVSLITDDHFVSGSDDGYVYFNKFSFYIYIFFRSIALWSNSKKNPLSVVKNAHTDGKSPIPNWISSVAACKYTDVIASGSSDGFIKLWCANPPESTLSPIMSIPMVCHLFVIVIVYSLIRLDL